MYFSCTSMAFCASLDPNMIVTNNILFGVPIGICLQWRREHFLVVKSSLMTIVYHTRLLSSEIVANTIRILHLVSLLLQPMSSLCKNNPTRAAHERDMQLDISCCIRSPLLLIIAVSLELTKTTLLSLRAVELYHSASVLFFAYKTGAWHHLPGG